MDTKKLRQKILDLAIRGKLVPQDPSDEPASLLLQRIRDEKERLIKEGKIMRSKKAAADDDIEAPFEIPESWEWVTINEICSSIIAGGDKPDMFSVSKTKECSFPVYANAIQNDGLCGYSNIPTILNPAITISARGTIGFVCTRRTPFIPIVRLITAIPVGADIEYISFALKSLTKPAEGSSIPQLTVPTFKYTLVPIPPLKEQHRIVSSIERWFAVIDELESNEGDLLKAIDQAKSKILDLAIHGKLVPQDPNDEPAIDLLKRINSKFEACGNEDCPFEIPESWAYVSLPSICEEIFAGGDKPSAFSKEPTGKYTIPIFSNGVENDGLYGYTDVAVVNQPSITISARGTIGFACIRKSPFVPIIRLITIVPNNNMVNIEYLRYAILKAIIPSEGSSIPQLTVPSMKQTIIPLPPYQEQLRIVAKIEELFGVLDGIKEALEA